MLQTKLKMLVVISLALLLMAAAPDADVQRALKKAGELEGRGEFSSVMEVLKPFADSSNSEVEYALAFSTLNAAIGGRKSGEVDPKAIHASIDLAEKALAHGDIRAPNLLFTIYLNHVEDGEGKALDYLLRGVELKEPGAVLNYATRLYLGGFPIEKDVEKSCDYFRALAKNEKLASIVTYYLGLIQYNGQCGREAHPKEGMKLIQIAADLGNKDAQKDVGKNYEFGWTVPVDLKNAVLWYEKAAVQGQHYALWRVGMTYVNGEFRNKDPARAVEYFKQSAAAGNTRGMVSLAVMYVTGDGIEKDMVKARELYEEAGEGGDAHACMELAVMYINGEGVTVDPIKARVLYAKAVSMGDPEKPQLLRYIESKMSPEQLHESHEKILSEQNSAP